jgi:HEAT repeat protein
LAEQINVEHVKAAYREGLENRRNLSHMTVRALIHLRDRQAEAILLAHLAAKAISSQRINLIFLAESKACRDVIRYLGVMKSIKSVPLLLRIAQKPYQLRESALRSLGMIHDKSAIPELLRLANNPKEHMRLPAIKALVHFDDERAVKKVLLDADKHMLLVLQEAVNTRPLSKAYIPMLAQVLKSEKGDESEFSRYALWALTNTGSPKARELILAAARSGNHNALYHLGGFPSKSTVKYLISILYEKTKDDHTRRQSSATSALARMPDASVPRLLKMLETETGHPFSFARKAMHAVFRNCGKQRAYSFLYPWDRQWLYPDVEYRGKVEVFSISSPVTENRQLIARTWRNWWKAQLAAKKTK